MEVALSVGIPLTDLATWCEVRPVRTVSNTNGVFGICNAYAFHNSSDSEAENKFLVALSSIIAKVIGAIASINAFEQGKQWQQILGMLSGMLTALCFTHCVRTESRDRSAICDCSDRSPICDCSDRIAIVFAVVSAPAADLLLAAVAAAAS